MLLETRREAIIDLATEGDRLGYDGFFMPEAWGRFGSGSRRRTARATAGGWVGRVRRRARDLHLSGFVPGIHLRVAGRADAMDLDDRFLRKPPVVVHGRRYPEEVPGDIALALALVDAVAVPEVYTAGDDSDVLVNWVEVRRHLVVRGEPEAVDERTGLARTAVDGRQLDAREGRK